MYLSQHFKRMSKLEMKPKNYNGFSHKNVMLTIRVCDSDSSPEGKVLCNWQWRLRHFSRTLSTGLVEYSRFASKPFVLNLASPTLPQLLFNIITMLNHASNKFCLNNLYVTYIYIFLYGIFCFHIISFF